MTTIVRYSVWIRVDDMEDDDYHTAVHLAFGEVPGFIESSWEDSYDDD